MSSIFSFQGLEDAEREVVKGNCLFLLEDLACFLAFASCGSDMMLPKLVGAEKTVICILF